MKVRLVLSKLLVFMFFFGSLTGQDDRDYRFPSEDHTYESILSSTQPPDLSVSELHYVENYSLDESKLLAILGHPNKQVLLSVWFKGKEYRLTLNRNFITGQQFRSSSSSGVDIQPVSSYFYKGTLAGTDGWATLSIIGQKVRIMIAHEDGNIEIVQQDQGYVGYENHDRKVPLHYSCDAEHGPATKVQQKTQVAGRYSADCLELYLECDYQSYLDNGSSVAQTEAWALSMINDVAALYSTINLPLVVESIFVHDLADPYQGLTHKAAVRDEFVAQLAGSHVARIGYLLSTRDLDGGISYGIGGYCSDYPVFPGPYAIATSLSSTVIPYPSYSFNTQVIAHELGHVLGARHTHACVWNGDDSQIDDCGNVWAAQEGYTPEGDQCFDSQSAIIPTSGTIMSLCDLVSGVGINLANGFSTEVGALIFDNYDNALCSTGGLCASIPPANDDCLSATELTSKPFCVPSNFDNIMATTGAPASASCGTPGSYRDVWFKYTSVGAFQKIILELGSGGLQEVLAIVYTGTCGNLSEVVCTQGSGPTISISVEGVATGVDLFIRIMESNGLEGGFSICIQDGSAPCHPYENELIALYNSAGGAGWTNDDGWANSITATNCNVCDWYGVTCDKDENIIELDLSFNNLVGTVPTSLGNIQTLRKVNLFSNSLGGSMPDIWGAMPDLEYLDLSANTFTGLIPRTIMGSTTLRVVYFENNLLQDTLPAELGLLPNIDVLWLKNNMLTGCFPSTFVNICDISSKTFTGNAGLPGSGDFLAFCDLGIGNDADFDGYCSGLTSADDCDDEDSTIYPGAPEICDGKDNDCDGEADEGSVITVYWTGPNGSWATASNWSTGLVPRACQDVVIDNGRVVAISESFEAYARSVRLLSQAELINYGDLQVSGSDDLGVEITATASFQNDGNLTVDNVHAVGLSLNGTFENTGSIFVRVLEQEAEIEVKANALFDNENGTIVLVHD